MIKLKPFRQTPGFFCGPASLKMVLDYYGVPVSESEFAKVSGASREQGVPLEGLVKAAKHFNFHSFYKENSTLDDIRYFIKRDIPVIVSWFSFFGGSYDDHYSVAVDIDKKDIVLMDPELDKILIYIRRRKLPLKDFNRVWFDFEGDFIKIPKDIRLRRLLVITPFKEKFPIKAKKINKKLKKKSFAVAKESPKPEKKITESGKKTQESLIQNKTVENKTVENNKQITINK